MKKNQRFHGPHRFKRKKSILKSRFFWLGILFLIITGGLFYFLFLCPFFDVKEIIISGNERVVKEEIENLIQKQILTDFKFFKNKNINLVSLKEIDKNLLDDFPQIAKVVSKKELPDSLKIEIQERKPVVLFKQNNNWFFVDKEGVIFEKNSEPSEETLSFATIQNLLLKKDLELGEIIAEKDVISKIFNLEAQFRDDLKIPLKELTIVSEERLNVKTSAGWEIYFNLKRDMNWQMIKLKAVLENRIPPEKRGNVSYIDLRFERVYIFPENYNE